MEGLSESFARFFTTRPAEEDETLIDDDPGVVLTSNGVRNLVGRVVSLIVFSDHSLKLISTV